MINVNITSFIKMWVIPKENQIDPTTSDYENWPEIKKLKLKGNKLYWIKKGEMSVKEREGFRKVIIRDKWLRPNIYINRDNAILSYRKEDQ